MKQIKNYLLVQAGLIPLLIGFCSNALAGTITANVILTKDSSFNSATINVNNGKSSRDITVSRQTPTQSVKWNTAQFPPTNLIYPTYGFNYSIKVFGDDLNNMIYHNLLIFQSENPGNCSFTISYVTPGEKNSSGLKMTASPSSTCHFAVQP